jgi:hypothetical protein
VAARHLVLGQRALRRGPWHIFHFIGHGGFDRERDEGYLHFADAQGNARVGRMTELRITQALPHSLRGELPASETLA